MGKLIVIEGLDGSGKATQASLLSQSLLAAGHKVRQVSFPNYESPASSLIKMYLSGEFGSRPEDVNAYAASAFYAVDRFASFKTDWQSFYESGGVVVADRYTTSNLIHQLTKLPPDQWDAFVTWLEDFEYRKMGIPRPDAVLYLDVAPAVSQGLLHGRYLGDETKKDIHESDLYYLEKCRTAAQWCVKQQHWKYVSCCIYDKINTEMRQIKDIAEQISAIVREEL